MGALPRDQVRGAEDDLIGELVHLTVTGLLIASLLALGAVGLSLTFGIARFANVAHPDFMMLGAYTTFAFNALAGMPLGWAAVLGVGAAMRGEIFVAGYRVSSERIEEVFAPTVLAKGAPLPLGFGSREKTLQR